MNQMLHPNRVVQTETSRMACEVEQFLGAGGQGEVYRAALGGRSVALKWYFPQNATAEQWHALSTLVQRGAPNNRFLWPLELARSEDLPGFGYVMALRASSYKGIVDLMKRRVEPGFRALVTAGMELADSYFQLHAKGLCYRDISFGNVFFDPDTGEVLICDNDNVGIDGRTGSGVLGTPRFMAPEIVRGEAAPSRLTDLFSLSVLLFYILMVHHPLEGAREAAVRCLDLPAMTELYGTHPVFIWDPQDTSNRPVPGLQDNAIVFWGIYPEAIRRLFVRAFTTGLHDPQNGRVQESEWRAALSRLRDSIVYCGHCGGENFYDADYLRQSGGRPAPCWGCGQEIQLPPRIRIDRDFIVMLNHDTQLYPHHVDDQHRYDFSQPVAAVSQHPTNPALWGLRNLSQSRWVAAFGDGTVRDVEPGRSVPLAVGTRILFGRCEGEIRL